jgi:hypothetical protein
MLLSFGIGLSVNFGVIISDRFFRIFESRLEFRMVLLFCPPLEKMLDGVFGTSGSTNDTAGDSFVPGVLLVVDIIDQE